MTKLNTAIKVPKPFQELFGLQTTSIDFILINIAAFAGGIFAFHFSKNLELSWLELSLVIILGLDIFGGVVANFTVGVKKYYEDKPRLRYFFIIFHLLQPSIIQIISAPTSIESCPNFHRSGAGDEVCLG